MPEYIDEKGNREIEEALMEFEVKSAKEEPTTQASAISEVPKMVQAIIKYSRGSIKNQRQAEYVLLAFVVVMVTVTFLIISKGTGSVNNKAVDEFIKAHPQFFRK
jgi:hypothetical protein